MQKKIDEMTLNENHDAKFIAKVIRSVIRCWQKKSNARRMREKLSNARKARERERGEGVPRERRGGRGGGVLEERGTTSVFHDKLGSVRHECELQDTKKSSSGHVCNEYSSTNQRVKSINCHQWSPNMNPRDTTKRQTACAQATYVIVDCAIHTTFHRLQSTVHQPSTHVYQVALTGM